MSLHIFAKNLQYLKKQKNLKQREIVTHVNKVLRKEFRDSADKEINIKRLSSYLEGRTYCPAYLLPVLCRVLGHKGDLLALFTKELWNESAKVSM